MLAELADTKPEFVRSGGLDKLVLLACPVVEAVPKEELLLLEDAPLYLIDVVSMDVQVNADPEVFLDVSDGGNVGSYALGWLLRT